MNPNANRRPNAYGGAIVGCGKSNMTSVAESMPESRSAEDILEEILDFKKKGNEKYSEVTKLTKLIGSGTAAVEGDSGRTMSLKQEIDANQKEAIKFYSMGIDVKTLFAESAFAEGQEMVQKMQVIKSQIFLNRSIVFQQRSKLQKALHDCKSAIQYDEENIKAYYRAAKVLMALDRFDEALNYTKKGIKSNGTDLKALPVEKQKLIRPLVKLRKEIVNSGKNLKKNGNSNNNKSNKKKNPLLGKLHKLSTAEESAKYNASSESKMLRKIKELANKHSSSRSGTDAMVERTFAALMDPKEFQRRIYPGLELPEGSDAPKDLKELLNDKRYQQPLEEVMPKVLDKAETVLRNVKRKGAAVGDIMDLETENILRPQILMEAFAREIAGVVNRTLASVAKHYAMLAAEVASPDDERATYDLIPESALSTWNDVEQGFCVIDNFINEIDNEYDDSVDEAKIEWSKVVQNDLKRLYSSKKLKPYVYDNYGRPVNKAEDAGAEAESAVAARPMPAVAWLKPDDRLKKKYPALFEVCESLQSLAFELNKKSEENLELVDPTDDQFLVTYLPVGCQMAPRYDGQNANIQNGIVTTATYFPYDMSSDVYMGLALTNGREIKVEVKTERVILHRSLKVMNRISKVSKQVSKTNVDEETNYLLDSECDGLFYISYFFSSKKGGDKLREFMKTKGV